MTDTTITPTPFPGAVSLTRVRVYDWEASDGVCGGSPHMHTASSEAYLVLSGRGRVETIRSSGYESYELVPDDLLWFSPGTIHRLVNADSLEILVIMQNSGLPEAGDAVLTFLPDILADPEAYARTAALAPAQASGSVPPSDSVPASDPLADAARARRDAAMAGYQQLKEAVLAGRGDAVAQFQRDAVHLVRGRVPAWRELWRGTIAPEAARTETWLDELEQGRFSHFADASVARSSAGGAEQVLGMCGRLQKWDSGHQA